MGAPSNYKQKITKNSAEKLKFGIIISNWNRKITKNLEKGVVETLLTYGVKKNDIFKTYVPGSFELIYAAKKIAEKKVDAIITIGCIIKGETPHFKYISNSVSLGIKDLNIFLKKPVIFGVLTTKNLNQAIKRSTGKKNKGIEFAISAIEMAKI